MNTKKEIARITLSSLAPDSLAQLQTMARLGLRVEAIVAEGSPTVVFVPLVAPTETIEMRIDAGDLRKAIDAVVEDMKAAQPIDTRNLETIDIDSGTVRRESTNGAKKKPAPKRKSRK